MLACTNMSPTPDTKGILSVSAFICVNTLTFSHIIELKISSSFHYIYICMCTRVHICIFSTFLHSTLHYRSKVNIYPHVYSLSLSPSFLPPWVGGFGKGGEVENIGVCTPACMLYISLVLPPHTCGCWVMSTLRECLYKIVLSIPLSLLPLTIRWRGGLRGHRSLSTSYTPRGGVYV